MEKPTQQTVYYPQYYPQYPQYPQYQAPGFAVRYKDPRKSGALKTLNQLALLMVAQTVLSLVLQVALMAICTAMGIDLLSDDLALVFMTIAISPVCTAGPPLAYMLVGGKDWNFYLSFKRASVPGCLLAVLAGLGVCMAANIPAAIVRDFLEGLGAKEPDSVLGQGGGWPSYLVELVGVAVLVPMLEEFAFRGVILSGLRRYGTGFALFASSLIFGMAHMSLSSVVFAAIAGAAMGAAYVLTGNLWVSVTIHALNNAIAVTESYCDLIFGPGNQELVSGLTLLGTCAVGLIALVLLLIARKRLFPGGPALSSNNGSLYPPLTFDEAIVTMLKSVSLWAIGAMVLVEAAMTFLWL